MNFIRHSTRVLLLASTLLTFGSRCALGAPVTTQSLVAELTDLARLAEFPSPAYTTRQFSSHDPKSTTPDDPKTWFANDDADHWQGVATHTGRTERVMMHADGPGAIVRIWSANPSGTLRIYLDGNETPAIEASMADLLGGKVKGIPSPIAGVQGKGFNFYLPIAYAKSCEVTTDAKGFYYHVDYRTYAAGTEVTSFKVADLQVLATDIERQAKSLDSPRLIDSKSSAEVHFDADIAAGETKSLGKLGHAGAINSLRVQVPADISEAALRGVVLRMTFDGETTVDVPLGDFFGTAPGINPYEALPMGMNRSGEFYSRWVMPFRESAIVEMKNLGTSPVKLSGAIGSVDQPWTDRSLHFHAGYRADADVTSLPPFDWNYLTAKGRGRFVGTSFTIDNPSKAWWGEGDEKFYVDGETFPSWFGTGSEDYFSYAWGWPGLFHHAYHNQPRCDGPVNYGRTSVNRFHIIDDVPFTNAFKFDMEIYHWKKCKINLAETSYWYAAPGGGDAFAELTAKDVVVHPMPAYKPRAVAGAIEGEEMKVLEHTADVDPQDIDDLSGDRHLLWHGAKEGERLVLGFNVKAAGDYHVRARFLKANDYGIVALAINDKPAAERIDLYAPEITPSDVVDLGTFALKAGENTLTVTSVGTNPAGRHEHLFGLDYLLLDPTR